MPSFEQLLKSAHLAEVSQGLSFIEGIMTATLPVIAEAAEADIPKLETTYRINQNMRAQLIGEMGENKYKHWILSEDRKQRRLKHIGGIGITSRTYEQVIDDYPHLEESLHRVKGDVIILGNGASSLPLELLSKNSEISHITVVDIFDINVAIGQLSKIITLLTQVKVIFSTELVTAKNVLENIRDNQKITYFSATVGNDSLDNHFGQYDTVINIVGPRQVSDVELKLKKHSNSEVISTYQK